jgi:hypothetical protein
MSDVTLSTVPSSPAVIDSVSAILGSASIVELEKFYDRDPTVCGWYYQAYVADDGVCSRLNSITNGFLRKREAPVVGDVLIVKNGPLGAAWETRASVDKVALAQTIWWYQKSGRDMSTVFGERGFMRVTSEL